MALKSTKNHPSGFTLVELMVVLVILGIISIGSMTAIVGQSKVFHSEEDIIDMQMNARIAMDRICFLLRMAGVNCSGSFGNQLTSGNLVTKGDVATNPTTAMFTITNNDPPSPDQLTLVGAIRYAGYITAATTTSITLNSEDHKLDSTTNSCIIISPSDNNEYKKITATSDNILTIALEQEEVDEINNAINATNPITGAATPIAINVYQVQAFTIRLVDTLVNDKTLRSLRIDKNISTTGIDFDVADNIQDIQFQYGIDTGSDGLIDSWVNDTSEIRRIKAVRVFILARTGKFDKEYIDRKTYIYPDGTSVSFEGNDNYNDLNTSAHVHRYVLESTISIRNRNF